MRVGDNRAGVELHRATGQRGNLGFTVETHDYGAAGTVDFTKSFRQPGNAKRIEASGGLVEEQDGGPVNQGTRDGDALAHATRKCADLRIATVDEANFAQKFFGASLGIFYTLEFCEKDQVLFGSEFVVDHGGVGNVTGARVNRSRGIGAGEAEFAGRWLDDLGGDAEQSGFAGAIASRKGDAFAGGDFEGDAAKGVEATVTFIDFLEAQAGWWWSGGVQFVHRLNGARFSVAIVKPGLKPLLSDLGDVGAKAPTP